MLHENITTGDIHYLQNWSVADTTARDALSVAAVDVGKVCQVTGTSAYYILTDDSPMTWQLIGSGGGGTVTSVTSANADATVATTTTTPVITIVQAPALRSATTTVSVSSATAPTSGQVLTATNGTTATWQTPSAGSGITLATPQASTSGTSIDFTSIPAGTKRILILFNGVSISGSTIEIRIGDSGGFETTGYLSTSLYSTGGSTATAISTSGFQIPWGGTEIQHGIITLALLDSSTFTWTCSGGISVSNVAGCALLAGSKSLSAELTQVRITTTSGTNAFDAGKINIQYQS